MPYSLHSNFKEIHEFVGGISPHMIIPIVKDFPDENKLYYAEQQRVSKQQLFSDQTLFETTSGDYRSEMEELRHLYCSPATLGFASLL